MGKSEKIYGKYIIHRTDGTPIDPKDEYFVLKVKGSGDKKHVEACRQALLTYAICIRSHLPELASDIETRYSDSHSPTEPEFDTLQEGDWMVGTFEEYKYLYELEGMIRKENCDMWAEMMGESGIMYWIQGLDMCIKCHEENKLTAPEFIRRAENTFKTK